MYIGLLEDEPHLAQYVCEILQNAGHTVAVFNNGADMVKALGRDTMDLYILDWRVPRMSGIEVLKHTRLDDTAQDLHLPSFVFGRVAYAKFCAAHAHNGNGGVNLKRNTWVAPFFVDLEFNTTSREVEFDFGGSFQHVLAQDRELE